MKPILFSLAKKVSQKSRSKYRLGCVIARRGKAICLGYNQMDKTHPKSTSYTQTIHAELHALFGTLIADTKGCVAYVYRETKDGKLALAKPCQMCEQALRAAGIKRVHYTSPNGFETLELE